MSGLLYLMTGLLNLFWLLIADKLNDLTQIAIPLISVLFATAGVLLKLDGLPRARRRQYVRRALLVLLVYYTCIVCAIVFFGGLFGMERGWGGAVNLEPFYSIRRYIIHYRRTGSLFSFFNLLGNVLLFLPLGILLPLIFRTMRRWWLCLPVLVVVCVGVEYLQWVFGVGVADVDDSILNLAGALAGYVPVRLCQLIWQQVRRDAL
ncbi:MAG: VanZ family protein [Oscillospiraceae bacterium]|nr:VanZ family protein [Oscillospiraceae bacterium]